MKFICSTGGSLIIRDGNKTINASKYCVDSQYSGSSIVYWTCKGKDDYTGTWKGTCRK